MESILADDCPDQILGDECEAHCRLDFISCRDSCIDSLCETQCLNSYTGCVNSCPCSVDCVDGCVNCPHPLCYCKEPEKSNPIYQQCVKDASHAQTNCNVLCGPSKECFDSCYESFMNMIDLCPCMKECPDGCPCENGYKCQSHIMVLSQSLEFSLNYVISADGNYKQDRFFEVPSTPENAPYLYRSGAAQLNGQMFFFGGESDKRKIGILDLCRILPLSSKLLHDFDSVRGSLVTVPTSPMEIMLCFGHWEQNSVHNSCEDFDGVSSRLNPYSSNYHHKAGCLALNNNTPTAVGGGDNSHDMMSKVEIFGLSGWRLTTDHPLALTQPSCLSIENGLLSIGGQIRNSEGAYIPLNNVFMLRDGSWTNVGMLKDASTLSSALFFGGFILNFSGAIAPYNVERLEWNGTMITEATIIANHLHSFEVPLVFESLPDTCEESCEKYCFNNF